MFSRLRSQDKKAQNSPIWLTLHVALLTCPRIRNFPTKEVTKFDDETIFLPI
jgi:hypothetical protein